MRRLRFLIASTTIATLLALPVASVTAAQPVSLQQWCLAPGNVVTFTLGWPPNWSPVRVDAFGYAVGVGDSVHVPDGNPVTVKGSTFTWTWVTVYPTAEHFVSTELSGRFDKNGGPQEWFLTSVQGALRDC
jgi:hypothetical protein